MKNINKILALIAVSASVLTTSCIKETFPQSSTVTSDQANGAPGAFDNFVNTITSTLAGSSHTAVRQMLQVTRGISAIRRLCSSVTPSVRI